MRDPEQRLADILDAIEHIERYATRGRSAFEDDELIQSWFIRFLQVIGEAARALPQEIREKAPGVDWSEIIGMRHVLVHDYFGIDTEVVWNAVEEDLPRLKAEVIALIRSLGLPDETA